jgi:hypothetical protein
MRSDSSFFLASWRPGSWFSFVSFRFISAVYSVYFPTIYCSRGVLGSSLCFIPYALVRHDHDTYLPIRRSGDGMILGLILYIPS